MSTKLTELGEKIEEMKKAYEELKREEAEKEKMKKGDKVRFRDSVTCKWDYGFFCRYPICSSAYPYYVVYAGNYEEIGWKNCEPFDWTEENLKEGLY